MKFKWLQIPFFISICFSNTNTNTFKYFQIQILKNKYFQILLENIWKTKYFTFKMLFQIFLNKNSLKFEKYFFYLRLWMHDYYFHWILTMLDQNLLYIGSEMRKLEIWSILKKISFSYIPITEEKFNIICFLCLKTNIIEVKFKNIWFYIWKQILLNT